MHFKKSNANKFRFLQVAVKLLDRNDHAPKFQQHEMELEIPENAAIETRFFVPSASDPDSTAYSIGGYVEQFYYSFISIFKTTFSLQNQLT